ncbi:MAG: phosphoribosyltransferase [Campylobacter sp.]|nr:phosphoribosyltransferase [Campylobacter sp.]
MTFYSYGEFEKDVKEISKIVADRYSPDALVAIARGGLTLGHFMAIALKSRNLFTLNSIHYNDEQKLDTIDIFNVPNLSKYRKILLIDDIVDSGESMVEILRVLREKYPKAEFKVATIFYKPHALVIPDFTIKEATDWIEFFWDIEL